MSMNHVTNLRGIQGPQGEPGPPLPDTGWVDATGWVSHTGFTSSDLEFRRIGVSVYARGSLVVAPTPPSTTPGVETTVLTIPSGFRFQGYRAVAGASIVIRSRNIVGYATGGDGTRLTIRFPSGLPGWAPGEIIDVMIAGFTTDPWPSGY